MRNFVWLKSPKIYWKSDHFKVQMAKVYIHACNGMGWLMARDDVNTLIWKSAIMYSITWTKARTPAEAPGCVMLKCMIQGQAINCSNRK